jgi:glyoxylase-like metal-dependent hydrolase (beta-lactamase superfamily II)
VELIVIGSGTGVPSLRRGSPSLAVRAAGRLVVLDLGAGSLRAMLRFGLNFNQIDILALSHRHPDHVGDLVPFLFATRYALGYSRQEPFWLLAARGFGDFYTRLKVAFDDWVAPPEGLMKIQELSPEGPDEIKWEGLIVKSAPTNHTEAAWAFVSRPGAGPWSIPAIPTRVTPWWPLLKGRTCWFWRPPCPSRFRVI